MEQAALEHRIAAAMALPNADDRIRELDAAFRVAEAQKHLLQALLALQLLQPHLVLVGDRDRAEAVDREIRRLKQEPIVAEARAAPIPPTVEKLIDRTTSATCVYLAVDIGRAAEIRSSVARVARLQVLKRKARRLGCEAATMKALDLLRVELKKPKDRRRLAHIEAEVEEVKQHIKALRAKADAE